MEWESGYIYKGNWVNDMIVGIWTKISPEGYSYKGSW